MATPDKNRGKALKLQKVKDYNELNNVLISTKQLEQKALRQEQLAKISQSNKKHKNGTQGEDLERLIEADNLMLESLNKKIDLLNDLQ